MLRGVRELRNRDTIRPGPLTEHQHADDRQVDDVGGNAGGKGRRIRPEVVVKRAGNPSPERHATAAEQEERRNAPVRFRGRKQLADRQQ